MHVRERSGGFETQKPRLVVQSGFLNERDGLPKRVTVNSQRMKERFLGLLRPAVLDPADEFLLGRTKLDWVGIAAALGNQPFIEAAAPVCIDPFEFLIQQGRINLLRV